MATPVQPASDSERLLVAYLRGLEESPIGWQAAHVRLSRLSSSNRREYNTRIVVNNLIHLARKYQGRVFVAHNQDVILVCKGAPVAEVEKAIYNLKYLFQDDPVARDPEFANWFDLSVKLSDLLEIAYQLLKQKVRHDEEQAARAMGAQGDAEPLDPSRLYKLLTVLSSVDIGSYMRRQPICALARGEPPQPVFEECFVRIADLQRPLMPNVNLVGNRWLFQHLTQSLDFRVLALLSRHTEEYIRGPISLNLNIDTVLSNQFMQFDDAVRRDYAGAIVVEVQAFDVFADIKAFVRARDYLHGHGYRLCLDGLSPFSFDLFDRAALGVDLLKINWDEGLTAGLLPERESRMAEAIRTEGPRLILARCDDDRAIEFGRSVGIAMFQGHEVDRLVNPLGWRPN
mgnify:CR=1 FL=1